MAYSKFEQTYVDAYLNNMYPDVEEEVQTQDTMLASAPTAEPTGQVTVSGFQPQQDKMSDIAKSSKATAEQTAAINQGITKLASEVAKDRADRANKEQLNIEIIGRGA